MKCKNCGSEMTLEIQDIRSDGTNIKYWQCNDCASAATEYVSIGRFADIYRPIRKQLNSKSHSKRVPF